MDKLGTLERKLIPDKIFESNEIDNKTQEYYEKIDGNIRQFFSTISEFIPSYITTLVYPDSYEYSTISSTNKALVEKTIGDLFITNNNIKNHIKKIKNENDALGSTASSQSIIYTSLLGDYQDMNSINNGADILLNESIDLYKIQYLINLFIIIGIIILIISLYQIYKNK
jgi:hypothetical protein